MHHCCGGGDEEDHYHSSLTKVPLGTHFALALDMEHGVLAREAITAHAVIEEAGVIVFSAVEYEQMTPASLASRCTPYITERGEKRWVMPLGSAVLCRQATNPSARLEYYETDAGLVICKLIAHTAITAGEAITLPN